ncbi:hypothetical protein ACOSP7_009552 [Xanthoceras sorbifolium]
MLAKLIRAANSRKDKKELRNARKNLNVNEEYVSALRTKSYVDFFSKAQLLVNELPSSPSFCHQEFSEILLEPDQETIPTILESAIISNMPQLKGLLLNYFDISAEASNICGHLLRKTNQIQYEHQFIQKTLDSIDDYNSPDQHEKVKFIISKMNPFSILNNPFSDPNKMDFNRIHDEYTSVLNCLTSNRKKVARKIKIIKYFHKASGVCITAACSLIAITAIVLAAHSLTALLMGPLFFSFPTKCFKKKLFRRFRCLRRSGLLKKVREQLDVAAKGTYILNRDFDTIGRLVARLHDEVEHNKAMMRLCLERSSGEDRFSLHVVVNELKKSSVGFQMQVEELEEHVYLCLVSINRARALLIKEMTKSCVQESS